MSERVISADDHIDLTYLPQDLWQKRLPAKHRDKGPRVEQGPTGPIWVREGKRWGFWGSKRPENQIIVYDKAGLDEQPEPGVWRAITPKYRLEDMDNEGVYAQVLYNFLDWSYEDQELKAAVAAAYNDWLAEAMCSVAPNRLIGLATLTGEGESSAKELRRAQKLGLRGGFLEIFTAPKPIFDPSWEPLWEAAEETGMPISVHTGGGSFSLTKIPSGMPWKLPSLAAVLGMQMDEVLTTMILSGVLERHPGLKFVLGESGIGWIPYVLERCEYEVRQYQAVAGGVPLKLSPQEVFRRQVYATFSDEKLGARLIPEIGVDNCMWAADYPHGDGSFPHSKEVRERMFGGADAAVRRKVLHDNAATLYSIN
jgi:predicted TIM-barrel fold metal-dependent hydrolase